MDKIGLMFFGEEKWAEMQLEAFSQKIGIILTDGRSYSFDNIGRSYIVSKTWCSIR